MRTGLGLGPCLSKAKDRIGPDLQTLNSYKLKTTDGVLLNGKFNARHLRPFEPREGMELAALQEAYMEKLQEEGQTEEVGETEDKGDDQAEESEDQEESAST